MAISTTDVLTSAITTSDAVKNGTIVLSVSPVLGSTQDINTYVVSTPGHTGVQTKYTHMFDEVAYYNTASGISGGGA